MATRGKEVQDFIKENKKSARQRFEEAGWEFKAYNNSIFYTKDEVDMITFDREKKYYYSCNGSDCINIDMETHKLITYQLQELGWL